MNSFLRESAEIYQKLMKDVSQFSKVRIVIGNESCDLDSAIAPLVYAYILYHETQQKGLINYHVLPMLNIAPEDLPLRTDVNFYLKLHGLNSTRIPTKGAGNAVSLLKLHEAGILDLTLVDHHTLPPKDQLLIPAVVEVIDHRPQDADWTWPNADVTISPVGSCCTLIANKILERCPHLLSLEISHLLLGPILVDTFNFSEEAKRATDLDHHVMRALELKVSVDRTRIFQDLVQARTAISGLTDHQILRKDMKLLGVLPICGLPLLVVEFLRRPGIEKSLLNFLAARHAPALVLMGLKVSEANVEKDLAVVGGDVATMDQLVESLVGFDSPSFDLVELAAPKTQHIRVFRQGNVTLSRKQVIPVITWVSSKLNTSSPR